SRARIAPEPARYGARRLRPLGAAVEMAGRGERITNYELRIGNAGGIVKGRRTTLEILARRRRSVPDGVRGRVDPSRAVLSPARSSAAVSSPDGGYLAQSDRARG